VRNLAADPAHRGELERLRARLDQWMRETGDRGPEAEAMYDSDMRVYARDRGGKEGGRDTLIANIARMKRWAAEGR